MLVGDACWVTVFEAEAASSKLDDQPARAPIMAWAQELTKPSLRHGGVDAEASFA